MPAPVPPPLPAPVASLSAHPRPWSEPLFWTVSVLASMLFAEGFTFSLLPSFSLHDFAYGLVESPFRRRVLMEWVYRLYLLLWHGRPLRIGLRTVTAQQQVLFGIALVSVLLTVALARRVIESFLGRGTPFRWFALLPVYMLACHELLVPDIRAQFPYDLPTVLFFGAGLFAAVRRNRWAYYPCFLVGTLNRETTLFLPLVFLLSRLSLSLPLPAALRRVRWPLIAEMGMQLLLWKGTVALCEHLTGGHGTGMKVPWNDNARMLANPIHWPVYASTFGFTWIPFLAYRHRIGNLALSRCALLLPAWWLVMFFVGDPLEIRLYNEWIPYMTVCLALIASHSFDLRSAPASLNP